MPQKRDEFIRRQIYHLVLRAIDDNLLFKDIDDHFRAIFSIFEFNDLNPSTIQERRKTRKRFKKRIKKLDRGLTSIQSAGFIFIDKIDKRDKLVEILAFCIMPNHIHLLVRQLKDGGITKFMRKLGTGYAGYFNRKYDRRGHLFQNTFNSIHVKNDNQLRTLFTYNHTNPISIVEPKWKKIGIKDPDKVIKFLEEEYRWSSYFDYIEKKNFPSITERKFLLEIMGGEQGCKDAIENWVRYKGEIREFPEIILE